MRDYWQPIALTCWFLPLRRVDLRTKAAYWARIVTRSGPKTATAGYPASRFTSLRSTL
jgi:hypothetical protein